MYILGINIGRNTADALIKDGDIVAAVEEARFNREKGTDKFPINSIKFCLDFEKITLNEIDYIAFSYNLKIGIFKLFLVFLKYFPKSLEAAFIKLKKFLVPTNYLKLISRNFNIPLKNWKKKL